MLSAFRSLAATILVRNLDNLRADHLQIDTVTLQYAGGDSLTIADQADEEVPRTNIVMVETARFLDSQFDGLLGTRREVDIIDHHAVAAADDELYSAVDFIQVNAQIAQDYGGNTFTFPHQTEE